MFRWLLLLSFLALAQAYGDQITITGFVSPTVETYDGLDAIFSGNCGGIPCANTPVVIHGNTYNTDDGTLRDLNFNPQNASCTNGNGACINTDDDLGFIDITFGTPIQRVGGRAETFGTAEFDFYASNGTTLLGKVTDGSGFEAWQDVGGIGRLRVIDTERNSTSMIFDDLTFEGPVTSGGGSTVPEPTSGVLLAGSMLLAACGRTVVRRRKT